MSNQILANWNGTLMPLSDVRVSVLDRAFLFGDAVYEAMRVYEGRPFLIDRHFARLRASLRELRIECDTERLRARVEETLRHSQVASGLVYLQVTRGVAPSRTHAFPNPPVAPNELVWIQPYADADPLEPHRATGVDVVTHVDLRWKRCDIKTVNLLGNCLAAQAAKEAGAYEAILLTEAGEVTEGSHTSLFGVRGEKVVTTPGGPHILPGVTRAFVFERAHALGIQIEEMVLRVEDLRAMDELFLTGTSTEVLAIRQIDGVAVGTGAGKVTAALASAYRDAVRRWLAGEFAP